MAAGSLLIQEAGGQVTDIDGSPYTLSTRAVIGSNKLVSTPGASVASPAAPQRLFAAIICTAVRDGNRRQGYCQDLYPW